MLTRTLPLTVLAASLFAAIASPAVAGHARQTVAITPASGATLSGPVVFVAKPSGAPLQVEFLLDGTFLSRDSTLPYEHGLDTAKYADGRRTLTVRVVYGPGGHTTTKKVAYTFRSAAPDPAPPPDPAPTPEPEPTPPPPTGAFASPGISTGGNFQYYDDATMKRELDGHAAIGSRSIRVDCPWTMVEGTRGKYDWTRCDRATSAARARGLSVLISLSYTPGWANGGRENKYPPYDEYFPSYAAFAREAAKRYYPQGVAAYEIWNEPNLGCCFWKPNAEPERYGRLLTQAYTAIKDAVPGAIVVGMALSPAADSQPGNLSPVTFAGRVYDAGGKLDALSVHPYLDGSNNVTFNWEQWGFGGSGSWFGPCPSIRCLMVARGDGAKQLWATEAGQPQGGQLAAAAVAPVLDRWRSYAFAGPLFWYNYFGDGGYSFVDSNWNPQPAWFAFRDHSK